MFTHSSGEQGNNFPGESAPSNRSHRIPALNNSMCSVHAADWHRVFFFNILEYLVAGSPPVRFPKLFPITFLRLPRRMHGCGIRSRVCTTGGRFVRRRQGGGRKEEEAGGQKKNRFRPSSSHNKATKGTVGERKRRAVKSQFTASPSLPPLHRSCSTTPSAIFLLFTRPSQRKRNSPR